MDEEEAVPSYRTGQVGGGRWLRSPGWLGVAGGSNRPGQEGGVGVRAECVKCPRREFDAGDEHREADHDAVDGAKFRENP